MISALSRSPPPTPGKHPLQATIPSIRNGSLSAAYYGQRRRGDFYDFVSLASGKVLFGLFDVAGELQESRPIMLDLQRSFRNWGTRLLNEDRGSETDSLIDLWILCNRATLKSAGGVHACAVFFGCYDEQSGILSYVNAGHTPALVRHKQKIRQLEATALSFGLFSGLAPGASVVALHPRDALLLVSKGVVEASYRGEEYGLQRAADCLDRSPIESAHEVCFGLLERVRRFMHAPLTHDDVTAMALVRAE